MDAAAASGAPIGDLTRLIGRFHAGGERPCAHDRRCGHRSGLRSSVTTLSGDEHRPYGSVSRWRRTRKCLAYWEHFTGHTQPRTSVSGILVVVSAINRLRRRPELLRRSPVSRSPRTSGHSFCTPLIWRSDILSRSSGRVIPQHQARVTFRFLASWGNIGLLVGVVIIGLTTPRCLGGRHADGALDYRGLGSR